MPRRAELLVSRVQWPSRKHCNRYPGQEGRSLGEPVGPIYRGGRGGEQPPGEPLGDGVRPSTTGRLCAKCCQRQVSKPHGEASNKCKALVSAGIGDRDTNEGFFSCLPPLRKQCLLGGGEGGLIEYTIPAPV